MRAHSKALLAQEHARASIDAGHNKLLSESLDGVSCRPKRCNCPEKYHETETEAKWNWSSTERAFNSLPLQDPAVIAADQTCRTPRRWQLDCAEHMTDGQQR